MVKKIITIFLFVISIGFINANQNDFIEPDEAFKINITQKQNGINIKLKQHPTVYSYEETFKVLINEKDITQEPIVKKYFNNTVVEHGKNVYKGTVSIDLLNEDLTKLSNTENINIKVLQQGCSEKGLCYPPTQTVQDIKIKKQVSQEEKIVNEMKDKSFVGVLVIFFIAGFLLSLTPCVLPMVPILSGIIVNATNNSEDKKISAKKGFGLSLIYVLGMSFAYSIAGIVAASLGTSVQSFLQNPTVIYSFVAIILLLALSMFGAFTLQLPATLTSKINSIQNKTGKSGYYGIFALGGLGALIASPCVTPPLAASLVYISQTGDMILGGLSLFVLSLAMGIPLLVMGAGAGKLIPKPGAWMNIITTTFGWIMVGLAIYIAYPMINDMVVTKILIIISVIAFITHVTYIMVTQIRMFGYKTISKVMTVLTSFIIMAAVVVTINENFYPQKENKQYLKKLNEIKVSDIIELDLEIKTTKKPIILDFWASWCVVCKELEVILKDDQVQEELKKYKFIKVDVTKSNEQTKQILKEYKVFGPPALIFIDENKNIVESKKQIGILTKEELLKKLKQ